MASQLKQMLAIVDLHKKQSYLHAAEAAHTYLRTYPEDEIVLQILADSAIQSGNVDAGEKVVDVLLARKPTASRLVIKATACSAQGNLAQAEVLLKDALVMDATHAGAWSSISTLHRFRKDDKLITKAKRVLRTKKLEKKQRRSIQYALAKAMNDLGKWDQAWDHAARGAAEAETSYDPAYFQNWLEGVEQAFDPNLLKPRKGRGVETDAPVFIVGMPRSGTTLMEMILAASGSVTPMGEMTTIAEFSARAHQDDRMRGNEGGMHGWVRRWNDSAFTQAGEYYLQLVAQRSEGTLPGLFTDKLPNNLMYLGQISMIFPNARIIRMHRDPLDTCVSCYLGEFRNGHDYTYQTDWLADAVLGYAQIGDCLTGMFQNPVLDVRYEALVSDPEAQIRRVLEFVGVDWNADCLSPATVGYTTTTRSVAQVRESINAKSVGRWQRYANRIGPLAEALGVDLARAA